MTAYTVSQWILFFYITAFAAGYGKVRMCQSVREAGEQRLSEGTVPADLRQRRDLYSDCDDSGARAIFLRCVLSVWSLQLCWNISPAM